MKTKEELNQLKDEISSVGAKLAELNEDELEIVTGGTGLNGVIPILFATTVIGKLGFLSSNLQPLQGTEKNDKRLQGDASQENTGKADQAKSGIGLL